MVISSVGVNNLFELILFLTFGSFCIFSGLLALKHSLSAKKLPKTEAVIEEILERQKESSLTPRKEYKVFVSYYIDGNKYKSEWPLYQSNYKPGKIITVRYDPNNPEILLSGVRWISIAIIVFGIIADVAVVYTWLSTT